MASQYQPLLTEHAASGTFAGYSAPPTAYTASQNYAAVDMQKDAATVVPVAQPLIQQSLVSVTCGVCATLFTTPPMHIASCPRCYERTPAAPPPPGKMYTRCACNCLMLHGTAAGAVVCPRDGCRRTVILRPPPEGTSRGFCPSCNKLLQWQVKQRAVTVKCTQCRSRLLVNRRKARTRFASSITAGLVLLIVGIVFTSSTVNSGSEWVMYGFIIGGLIHLGLSAMHAVVLRLPEPQPDDYLDMGAVGAVVDGAAV